MDPILPVSAAAPRPAPAARTAGTEFETLVLTNIVETMLPKSDAIYGAGAGADVWRSQLAQTIAAQLAQAGTLGLADAMDIAE